MSERRKRIKLLAYLEAVSWSMLACYGMCSLDASDSSASSLWREVYGDLERARNLVLAMRQRLQTACTDWGLEAHDIAAQADRLVDGRYSASNAAPDEVGSLTFSTLIAA